MSFNKRDEWLVAMVTGGPGSAGAFVTDRYRFGFWHPAAAPDDIIGVKLYDHVTDPAET